MTSHRVFSSALLVPFLAVAASAQTTVQLSATKDNTLIEDNLGALSNGQGIGLFAGRVGTLGNTTLRRGVIAFDIAGNVPAGATIVAATLRLTMTMTTVGPFDVSLHPMTADWGEGTSAGFGGAGAASQAGDATWIHTFYPGSLWATAGGDFSATASATTSVDQADAYHWSSCALVADVQSWLDTPGTNFGWCVKGDEGGLKSAKMFGTREALLALERPVLTVTYTTTPAATVTFRNSGTNPASYTSTPAAIGSTWSASVDLTTTGHSSAVVLGFSTPVSVVLGGGQTLLGSGFVVFKLPAMGGPVANWSLPIPNDCGLWGLTAVTQAAHLGGVTPFALSNAQDLFIGY